MGYRGEGIRIKTVWTITVRHWGETRKCRRMHETEAKRRGTGPYDVRNKGRWRN